MKWVSANNNTAQENFELWEMDTKVAALSFNKNIRIARFVSKLSKRLFFFEKRGLLTPTAVIKNEYGIKMGKVEETKPGTGRGYVELNDKKYFFVYNENNSGELTLYDEAMKKSLLTCSFNTLSSGFTKAKSLLDTKFPSLLMALCWHVFQPNGITVTEAIA